ncbi:hypothetical protein HHI36_010957 [Cryptolaemus montrouzieri]|uniref:Uncharacterized protein n=1 Tax=Cryptolaemus montrouzieri TaxID=559131 RepID=A0ABD2MKC4_9CUCU
MSSHGSLESLNAEPSNSNMNAATNFFKLSFLCSLIPHIFDGNRLRVHEFISNCDNAFKFAHPSQEQPLLAYVISKISGNAKAQLRDKLVNTWVQLRELLLQLYADKKHYTMLMEELNTIKQQTQESVLSFHNNIEQIYTRIINSLPANSSDIRGRSETLRELALQRFIFHSKPDISRFLRSKDISTLPDARNAASDEERALNMRKIIFQKQKNIAVIVNVILIILQNVSKNRAFNSITLFQIPTTDDEEKPNSVEKLCTVSTLENLKAITTLSVVMNLQLIHTNQKKSFGVPRGR